LITFTYDGNTSATLGVSVLNVVRPLYPEHKSNQLVIPGRPGSYYSGYEVDERAIKIEIALVSTSEANYRSAVMTLASKLRRPVPCWLSFSDEANKQYKAIIGPTDWTNLAIAGRGTLNFICNDPFIYGTTYADTGLSVGSNSVTNSGLAPAYPFLTATATADSTHMRFTHQSSGKFIQIGAPPETEQTTEDNWPYVLNEQMATMDWGTDGIAPEGDAIKEGTMAAAGGYFYPSSYGASSNIWHGPCIRHQLSSDIGGTDNFILEALVGQNCHNNTNAYLGITDIYGVTAAGAVVFRLGVADWWTSAIQTYCYGGYGTSANRRWIYNPRPYAGCMPSAWASFDNGWLSIARFGTQWMASFGLVSNYGTPNEVWSYSDGAMRIDGESLGDDPIRYIDIFMATHSAGTAPLAHRFYNIWVKKLTSIGASSAIKYIKNGNRISVDCARNLVTRDGVPWMDAVHVGSQFFPLDPGSNTIVVDSGGTISNGNCRYTPRWW